jgi:hypothetical protein
MSDTNVLRQEIEALDSAVRAYDARYESMEDFVNPEGIRIAVYFICDFDAMLLRRVFEEPPMQLAQGEYVRRVGISRLIEMFDSQDVKAAIFTPHIFIRAANGNRAGLRGPVD